MATHYKRISKVVFGLMNEPVGSSMTSATWKLLPKPPSTRSARRRHELDSGAVYLLDDPVNFLDLNAAHDQDH